MVSSRSGSDAHHVIVDVRAMGKSKVRLILHSGAHELRVLHSGKHQQSDNLCISLNIWPIIQDYLVSGTGMTVT